MTTQISEVRLKACCSMRRSWDYGASDTMRWFCVKYHPAHMFEHWIHWWWHYFRRNGTFGWWGLTEGSNRRYVVRFITWPSLLSYLCFLNLADMSKQPHPLATVAPRFFHWCASIPWWIVLLDWIGKQEINLSFLTLLPVTHCGRREAMKNILCGLTSGTEHHFLYQPKQCVWSKELLQCLRVIWSW